MKHYNVVCVGAGYFAKFQIEAWTRIPEVALVGICDHDLEKARKLADQFNVEKVFGSLEEVYKSVSFDILDVITPPETHLALCAQAAEHGKHIICQKPLAPNFQEAKKLISTMNQTGVRFMVHENFRFQPWYRKIKDLLGEKVIGDTFFTINHRMRMGDGWPQDAYLDRQPYFREMPRLLIHETGIHFVDVFRFLMGEVDSVYARLRRLNPNIRGEDTGMVLFDFKNGCQGIFDGNRYNESNAKNPRYTFGQMLIEGSGGSLRLETDGSIYLQQLGMPEEKVHYTHEDINFSGDCVYSTQKHFIECLKSGEDFETNANVYLKNLKIQEAIYESAKRKVEISVGDTFSDKTRYSSK